MAAAFFLVSKSDSSVKPVVNGLRSAVVLGDDSDTDSEVIAAAVAAANTVFDDNGNAERPADPSVPGDYFDTVELLTDALQTAGDALLFHSSGSVPALFQD